MPMCLLLSRRFVLRFRGRGRPVCAQSVCRRVCPSSSPLLMGHADVPTLVSEICASVQRPGAARLCAISVSKGVSPLIPSANGPCRCAFSCLGDLCFGSAAGGGPFVRNKCVEGCVPPHPLC